MSGARTADCPPQTVSDRPTCWFDGKQQLDYDRLMLASRLQHSGFSRLCRAIDSLLPERRTGVDCQRVASEDFALLRSLIMFTKSSRTLVLCVLLGCSGHGYSGETPSGETASSTDDVSAGNSVAGLERYNQSCVNCHGAGGKGVASYPKVSGNEISYTTEKLETYREGIKIGPNSSLMIMMAKPLTDEDIANLAAYLQEATP